MSLCTAVVLLGTPVTTFASTPYTLVLDGNTIIGVNDGSNNPLTEETAAAITTIEIPATVKNFEAEAFDLCTSLKTFTLEIPAGETSHPFLSVGDTDGALYSKDGTTLYRLPPAFATADAAGLVTYTLPATVTAVSSDAFTNCSRLARFDFGSGSSALRWSASSFFAGCSSLAVFVGSRTLTSGWGDFTHLSSLGGALVSFNENEDGSFACLVRVGPAATSAVLTAPFPSTLLSAAEGALAGLSVSSPFPLLFVGAGLRGWYEVSHPEVAVFCPADSPTDAGSAPFLGYITAAPGRLLLTSRSGDTTTPLTLACDTFDGYTLALADDAPALNLTITHSGAPGTACSACGAGDVAPDPGADFLHDTVHVDGKPQRIRVYDPNGVLPADTTFKAEYVDGSHGDHNFFITHLDPATDVELQHFYNLTLTSAGQTLSELDGPVELWFEAIGGIDAADSFISRVAEGADAKLTPTLYTDADGVTWIKVLTDHFSPYALTDLLSEEEKATLAKENSGPKNNVKTGDLATQMTVAGLGMTLVLALGIMLRLITNKRNFEE